MGGAIGVIIFALLFGGVACGLITCGIFELADHLTDSKADYEYRKSHKKGAMRSRIKTRGFFIKDNVVEINGIKYEVLDRKDNIVKLMTVDPVPIYTGKANMPKQKFDSFVYYYKAKDGSDPCSNIDIEKAREEHRSALFEVQATMNFFHSQSGNDINGLTIAEKEYGLGSITEIAIPVQKRTSIFLTKQKKGDFQVRGENSNQNLKIIEDECYFTGIGYYARDTIRLLSVEDIFEYYGKKTITAEELKKFVNKDGVFWLHNFCTNSPTSIMCLNGKTGAFFYQEYNKKAQALAVITIDLDKLN